MRVILLANTSWYILNFRLALAKRLQADGHAVTLVSPYDRYSTVLQDAGFRWIDLGLSRSGLNPMREIRSIAEILSIYRTEQPDLVNHFTMKCIIYGSIAAQMLGSPKVINSLTGLGYPFSHGSPPNLILRVMLRLLLRLTVRRTTMIFQNPEDRNLFIRSKWTSLDSSYLVRSSGVDLGRYAPIALAPEPITVMLPGRMLRSKGIFEFVESIRLMRARGVDCRGVLVGDIDPGNPASIAPEQLQRWSAEAVIEWWGWEEHMEQIYAKAHIVCLPSYYGEGVPMSLVEAAACGLPIVAADTAGCREIVHDNVNGLLVPPRNAEELANALQLLIENPEIRKQFGARGREIAAGFSSERVVGEIVGIYARVLGQPTAPAP